MKSYDTNRFYHCKISLSLEFIIDFAYNLSASVSPTEQTARKIDKLLTNKTIINRSTLLSNSTVHTKGKINDNDVTINTGLNTEFKYLVTENPMRDLQKCSRNTKEIPDITIETTKGV